VSTSLRGKSGSDNFWMSISPPNAPGRDVFMFAYCTAKGCINQSNREEFAPLCKIFRPLAVTSAPLRCPVSPGSSSGSAVLLPWRFFARCQVFVRHREPPSPSRSTSGCPTTGPRTRYSGILPFSDTWNSCHFFATRFSRRTTRRSVRPDRRSDPSTLSAEGRQRSRSGRGSGWFRPSAVASFYRLAQGPSRKYEYPKWRNRRFGRTTRHKGRSSPATSSTR